MLSLFLCCSLGSTSAFSTQPGATYFQHHRARGYLRDGWLLKSSAEVYPEDIQEDVLSVEPDAKLAEAFSSEVITSVENKRDSYWNKFSRRLVTKEDTLGLHKFSAISMSLTGIAIGLAGAQSNFQEIPEFLEPLTAAFLFSTVLQAVTTFPMALSHRPNEPFARGYFLSMAMIAMQSAYVSYFVAPFCPDWLGQTLVSKGVFSFTCSVGFMSSFSFLTNFEDGMQETLMGDERVRAPETDDPVIWAQNFASAYAPVVIAMLINIAILVPLGILWDRPVIMHFFHTCTQDNFGVFQAHGFYQTTYLALAVSYVPFFNTLRDKRLISTEAFLGVSLMLGLTGLYSQAELLSVVWGSFSL